MITGAFAKVIASALIMLAIHVLQIYLLCRSNDHLELDQMFFFRSHLHEDSFKEQIGLVQRVNFLTMILMLNCLSIGFESNHALEKDMNNPRFLKQLSI